MEKKTTEMEATIRLKGYKKYMKKIKKMQAEGKQLNRILKETVELKRRLF